MIIRIVRISAASHIGTVEKMPVTSPFLPRYKVMLKKDSHNTIDYVTLVLMTVVGELTESVAQSIALEAHVRELAVVVICFKEIAEYYQERLVQYGLSVYIESE